MQKNAFRFMIKQIKCYNCHRVMLVQKWEAIFQMIYFMTYLTFRKIFYQDIRYNIAELSVLKAMVRIPIVAEGNYQNISEIIAG